VTAIGVLVAVQKNEAFVNQRRRGPFKVDVPGQGNAALAIPPKRKFLREAIINAPIKRVFEIPASKRRIRDPAPGQLLIDSAPFIPQGVQS
jgi:hypothetical protein